MGEAVRVRLLGGFRVSVGERVVGEDEWRLRKAGSLLKLLALAPGHRLPRERAMDLLWPGLGPKAAANNLHHALHVARKTLDPGSPAASGYLSLRAGRLALCPDDPLWVDVQAFEGATRAARRAREPAAYRAALDLYVGDLLPQDPYESWAEGRRVGLREVYLALLVEVAGLYEERGELVRAVEALQRLAAEEPARDEAHEGLMRLYAANGQRGRALDQYERLREALRRELGTEPGAASERLYQEIRAGQVVGPVPDTAQPEKPADAGRHNLPIQRTSFVGREGELLEVKRDLAMTRLLTLTGAGGSGKTRLALEAAKDLSGTYPDGVWLAELAPLSDPGLVEGAVASALGVREQPDRPPVETLAGALRGRETLLVLDNCEHVVDAASRLADALLDSCPGLKILATSREALGVAGEINRPVPPLSLPDPKETPTVEKLEGSGSVRLFVERALYRPSAFVLTPQNARAVAEICRQLDGIPLAIELAAARIGALAVEQLSERLSDSLGLLTGGARTATPRQRTLRGSLDWSRGLLDGPEKRLFDRLSVFAGGWTLVAAETVGAGDGIERGEVLDLLSRLVDKSLVVAGASPGAEGALRYRMLEPVRQYAREKLAESGEAEDARRRNADLCLAFAERADAGLRGAEQEAWIGRAESEHPNVRAALGWSLDADPVLAIRLAVAMGHFWYSHGHINEGRRWMEAALERTDDDLQNATRAKALRLAGILSEERGLYGRAAELYEEGLALYRRLGDREGVASSLNSLGTLAYITGDVARGLELTEKALAVKRELGDARGVMISLNNLAEMTLMAGDLTQALALFEECLKMCREQEDGYGVAIVLLNLGTLYVEREDPGRAEELLLDALGAFRRLGDLDAVAECLGSLAGAAGTRGEGGRAATLLGAAAAAREELGAPIRPVERDRYERFVALSKRGLNGEAWAAVWAVGRAMPLEEAADYALSFDAEAPAAVQNAPPAEPEVKQPATTLTRREEEVAVLAARGLTNRRIAAEFSISEHTAATHVRRILRKLGLASRAQLAAWATERGLPPPK